MTFEGKDLDQAAELTTNAPGVTAKLIPRKGPGNRLEADVTIPANTPAGVYQLTLKGPGGSSAPQPFAIDLFAVTLEQEGNNSPTAGQPVSVPATLVGSLDRAGDLDYYRFQAAAGQELGVQLVNLPGSKLEAVLVLTDSAGRVLAESSDGVLGYRCEQPGVYTVGIRDRDYRGEGAWQYRLHIGDIPILTAVYPLGLQRGTEADIQVVGVNLNGVKSVRIKAPADAVIGSKLPVTVSTPKGSALGTPSVVVGEFPEVTAQAPGLQTPVLTAPATANGRLLRPDATDTWKFTAKKGERLILEVHARRLGVPMDSSLEILDAKGQPVARATLRCVAKTYVTFRDHDNVGANIRIEAWSELAVNDYVYVGNELLRIKALPTHPDADCIFFSERGQRVGYLDTTPTHQPQGQPMYKVEIHPPGATFPPNGFPVFTIFYRNDDGGPGYGKDSRILFDPPADGEYQLRIGHTQAQGFPPAGLPYRVTIRPPRPSYTVSFTPTAPAVWRGGALPITVNADRTDGFDGEIHLRLENLPPGFSAPATSIPAGENSTAFALFAEPTAAVPAKHPPLKLIARATIGGQEVVRAVTGGLPKVVDPGEIVTTTAQSEITLVPGGETRLTVMIERRNGFTGRVPIEVKGLPHGVRVLDIGLNGILITERETTRTMVLYAEPWVPPMDHPIVVVAKREGKNTEHAARSVLLKIVPPGAAGK